MKNFIWGSLGETFVEEHKGETLSLPDVRIRKPQIVDVDVDFGERLTAEAIGRIRSIAETNGVPAGKVKDGFEKNLMLFTGSTEGRDRYGDRILVDGWELAEFKSNPVFLGFHDYNAPAIGQALDVFTDVINPKTGKSLVGKAAGAKTARKRLRFLMLWAVEENPMAKILHGLYKGKDMRASSVGFIPGEVHIPGNDDERGKLDLGPMGVLHKKQTLLELSAVSVPALPDALAEESFEAYRKSIPAEDVPGLEKLAEQMNGIDSNLAIAVRSFLPSTKTTVLVHPTGDKATIEEKTTLSPEGDLEDTAPGDGATHPGDKLSELAELMEDVEKIVQKEPEDGTSEDREGDPDPEVEETVADGGDGDPGDEGTKETEEVANRLVPLDISLELADPGDDWIDLEAEDFDFENLDEEARSQVAGFFAYTLGLPPEDFSQLKLAHHRSPDGAVNLNGVKLSMEELLSGDGEGADIPEDERRSVYDHLAAHFTQFDTEAPEFVELETEGAPAPEGEEIQGTEETTEELTVEPNVPKPTEAIIESIREIVGTEASALLTDLRTSIKREFGVDVGLEAKTGQKWRVVRAHKPKTAPVEEAFLRSTWEEKVAENIDLRRETSLIYDSNDTKNARSYLMPHHLAEEGTPVVWEEVKTAMRHLLSRSIDLTFSEDVRKRAYFHLRTHFEQFEREAPAFRTISQLASLGKFLRGTAELLSNGDGKVRADAELILDLVYMGFQAASSDAFELQALSFPKEGWEKEAASEWVREHGHEVGSVEETESAFVFVQREKSDFDRLDERRLDGEEGDPEVVEIGGSLKSGTGLLSEKIANLERLLESGITEIKQTIGGKKAGAVKAFLEAKRQGSGDDRFQNLYEEIETASKAMAESVASL